MRGGSGADNYERKRLRSVKDREIGTHSSSSNSDVQSIHVPS